MEILVFLLPLLLFIMGFRFNFLSFFVDPFQCFEGMKAYKDSQGRIRLFRPDMNMNRLDNSMQRMAMPPLDKEGFTTCMEELIRLDASWVPDQAGYSLYLRPLAIGTSVCVFLSMT
jgi:branched-subunit amino acid aminotransferase/4-amino-4-deoxychorismate lyase